MSKPTGPLPDSEMPAVEALTFRPIRGEQDADTVYSVRAGCVEADQVDLLSTSEALPGREEMRAALAELVAARRQDQRPQSKPGALAGCLGWRAGRRRRPAADRRRPDPDV